jgi:hypothetical protein
VCDKTPTTPGVVAMFNRWRKKYDDYSDEQHRQFYSEMYRKYPDQESYHLTSVKLFLDTVRNPYVFEFGGWDGSLAGEALNLCEHVVSWHNYDCCADAVAASTVDDHRYLGFDCRFNVWEGIASTPNTLVAAHSIEHIRQRHFHKLLDALPDLTDIYIDSPLPKEAPNWHGYEGTHIYEAGWKETIAELLNRGFVRVGRWRTGTNMETSTAYSFRRKL